MFDKENITYTPTIEELKDYINNPLWDKLCTYIQDHYHVHPKFEFSKCSFEYGWNVKFKKGSRSLCTVYPRENYFCVMIVIGKKEKVIVEPQLSTFTPDIQKIYKNTKEGNNQRWLMIDLEDDNQRYNDVKRLIDIRMI